MHPELTESSGYAPEEKQGNNRNLCRPHGMSLPSPNSSPTPLNVLPEI